MAPTSLIDHFALPRFVADAATLRLLDMNPAAAACCGHDPAAHAASSLDDLFPHVHFPAVRMQLRGPAAAPLRLPGQILHCRDGSHRPVDLHVLLDSRDGQEVFELLALDAGDRQQALDRLHYMLRATRLGYWDLDLQQGTLDVDTRWLDLHALARSDFDASDRTLFQAVPPRLQEQLRTRFLTQILYEDEFTLEYPVTGSSGVTTWIRLAAVVAGRDLRSGKPERVCGTVEDISVQHDAAEQLRLQQAQHSSLLNNTEDVICHFDRQHRHLYVNPAVTRVWNLPQEEYIGRTRREMGFPAEHCRFWEESVEQVFTTGVADRRISTYEGDRGTVHVYWYAFPGLVDNGEVRSVFTVSRDISDFARTEEELRRMQKLNSLGVLAGGIAHDFNNILTVLFGNIALARSYLPQDHRSQTSLTRAEQAFHRATHLTSQLLTFAKGGDPVKQDVSIASYIEEIVRFDLSGSNVKLVFSAAADLWMARVDKSQIAQVFSNLTSNANEAMPNGGHLYVTLENCRLQAGTLPGLAAGDYLRCIVRDEGTGIHPADLDKIFDPYFSTRQKGSGLGLATVYSIVSKHGGHIAVSSRVGQGTTFNIYLPASAATAATQTPVAPRVAKAAAAPRILIMDDEKMICELGSTFLGSKGYQVDTAHDGQQAIALYAAALQQGAPYDCLLMDLTIPGGMSGKDALTEILKLDENARAIVSSGYAADPVMANYEEHGFKGCITKPFFIAALLKEIRRVLGEPEAA